MTGIEGIPRNRMRYRVSRIWPRAWRALVVSVRERYRPEQHYMRGPGPKYRARSTECGNTKVTMPQKDNGESRSD